MTWLVCGWLVLAGVSCQTSPPEPISTQSVPTAAPSPVAAGQLAFIGSDGNVYVTRLGDSAPQAITSDATAPPENTGYSYHRLAWSPGGQLAIAGVTRSGDRAQSKLFVLDTAAAAPRLIAEDNNHFFIYLHWSPLPCTPSTPCQLAYLIEKEARQIGLHLLTLDGDNVTNQLLGQGRPFFFSWAPQGGQMAWHTNGSSRRNPAAQLALFDVTERQSEPLPHLPGEFLSPGWAPQSERWLATIATDSGDQLSVIEAAQPAQHRPLLDTPPHLTSFVWSPDGTKVAFASLPNPTSPFYGPIFIYDFETGGARQLTGNTFRISGFFWSPDGQKLAYLHRVLVEETTLQWRMYNIETGQDRGYALFEPSPHMRYVLSSFDQYAPSHRFWSPDSRYLVYSSREVQQATHINLIDTQAARGADPIFIAEGVIGFWSWE